MAVHSATRRRTSPHPPPKARFRSTTGQRMGRAFSHPRDFTPVCTTELGAVSSLHSEFEKRKMKVIGLSVDGLSDHER